MYENCENLSGYINCINPTTLFIENQNKCNVKYGDKPSSYNGCGWIAVYNFLIAKHKKEINSDIKTAALLAKSVKEDMEDRLLFEGLIGTGIFQISKIIPVKMKIVSKKTTIQRDILSNKIGILYYYNGYCMHYVTFENNDGQYTFYNAPGVKIYERFEDFYKNIKFPFFILYAGE